jgi:hypothetical protein
VATDHEHDSIKEGGPDMGTRYQDHMNAELDALQPAWAKWAELFWLGFFYALYLAGPALSLAHTMGLWK